jgi:hypothetical protein
MIFLFISIAVSEFNTLLSMATPSSVNAKGKYFMLLPLPLFKVTICDLEVPPVLPQT